MTIAQRRAQIATQIDGMLPTVKVRAYKPTGLKPNEGWLEVNQLDTQECTYGEVRLSITLVIPVSTSRQSFEKAADGLAVPIISAIKAAGGRAPVLTPTQESAGQAAYYSLSCTFLTESEAA